MSLFIPFKALHKRAVRAKRAKKKQQFPKPAGANAAKNGSLKNNNQAAEQQKGNSNKVATTVVVRTNGSGNPAVAETRLAVEGEANGVANCVRQNGNAAMVSSASNSANGQKKD